MIEYNDKIRGGDLMFEKGKVYVLAKYQFVRDNRGVHLSRPFAIVDRRYVHFFDDNLGKVDVWVIKEIIDRRGNTVPILGVRKHQHSYEIIETKQRKYSTVITKKCKTCEDTTKEVKYNDKALLEAESLKNMTHDEYCHLRELSPTKAYQLNIDAAIDRAYKSLIKDVETAKQDLERDIIDDSSPDSRELAREYAQYLRDRKFIALNKGECVDAETRDYEVEKRDRFILDIAVKMGLRLRKDKTGLRHYKFGTDDFIYQVCGPTPPMDFEHASRIHSVRYRFKQVKDEIELIKQAARTRMHQHKMLKYAEDRLHKFEQYKDIIKEKLLKKTQKEIDKLMYKIDPNEGLFGDYEQLIITLTEYPKYIELL